MRVADKAHENTQVAMARDAGARKVFFASCSPPITHPHIYGIDLVSPKELIASDKDRFEIARAIGADEMVFQSLDDLRAACVGLSPPEGPKEFEVGVFCGSYITNVPDGYFDHLAELYGERPKAGAVRNAALVGSSGPTNVANGAGTNGVPAKETHPVVREDEDINMHNIMNNRRDY
jgi:amidophosphoribosyltransferase